MSVLITTPFLFLLFLAISLAHLGVVLLLRGQPCSPAVSWVTIRPSWSSDNSTEELLIK